MKISRSKYLKVEGLTKITGLVLVAIGVDNVFKGNYLFALVLLLSGGLISFITLFIDVET